jgi:aryl-alcohol dehydrogenase-like predicted oxidoreductase
MIEYKDLSKIGFGAYRIDQKAPIHRESLRYALSLGCNLIDTASNYRHGDSEKIIGTTINELGKKKPFIITKGGYALAEDLKSLSQASLDQTVRISDTYSHNITPEFLEKKLKNSISRLGVEYIDCYMLHNPEYYLKQKENYADKLVFFERIKSAFEFLEEKVHQGLIRSYGISSNSLPNPSNSEYGFDLLEIIKITKLISQKNHFHFIQFPFNSIENDAVFGSHSGGKSLLLIAKENGIRTLTNRPLNANINGTSIRLAQNFTCAKEELQNSNNILEEMVKEITLQLKKCDRPETALEFPIIKKLCTSHTLISNPDTLYHLFENEFHPFLQALYDDNIPNNMLKLYTIFRQYCLDLTMININRITTQYKERLINSGAISNNDFRPLQTILVEQYLNFGIDHILVGMRKEEYVNDFSSLFF